MITAYSDDFTDGYVVEFFMPKKLDYISKTYGLLKEELEFARSKMTSRPFLYGFSIYEVDGAFLDDAAGIMEDRTQVIRVFFEKEKLPEQPPSIVLEALHDPMAFDEMVRSKALDIMERFAKNSMGAEKQIWAFRYDARVYKLIKL